jgi:hypothetical protein
MRVSSTQRQPAVERLLYIAGLIQTEYEACSVVKVIEVEGRIYYAGIDINVSSVKCQDATE